MPLPKIQQPLFDLTVPSTEKKVKFRPFTVKEEKILLVAQESKDIDQIINSIKQIVNNCVEDIDVDKLAMFDLEYILINLRSKSVSNEIEFKIRDPDTEEEVELTIDINDFEMKKDPEHNKVIQLSDDIHIVMSYPKIDQLKTLQESNEKNQTEVIFNMMMDCIESVVQDEEVLSLKDFTEQEVNEFLESLSSQHIQLIRKFFDTMPTLRYEKKYKRADGIEKTFVAEGTETFFI
jgi:hypothetical protein